MVNFLQLWVVLVLENPSVLLADEPTGNLDRRNSEEIMRLLSNANKMYGQTIILVTHDVAVGKMAKRKVVMSDGKIISNENI